MGERFLLYQQSLGHLCEALEQRYDIASRDLALRWFALTFDLSWKVIQDAVAARGGSCASPCDCFHLAVSLHILADETGWNWMADDRQRVGFGCDETTADEVYDRLNDYLVLFEMLIVVLDDGSSMADGREG